MIRRVRGYLRMTLRLLSKPLVRRASRSAPVHRILNYYFRKSSSGARFFAKVTLINWVAAQPALGSFAVCAASNDTTPK
jgi:hypothetical protein